jgi:hypothetical protein
LLVLALYFGVSIPSQALALEATATPAMVETLEEGVSRLSAKYGVSKELAAKIIWCESKNRPQALGYNKTESGEVWSTDYSYWQINDYYWEQELLEKHNWDIKNPTDNLEAGFFILSTAGTTPWKASENCWKYGTSEGYSR